MKAIFIALVIVLILSAAPLPADAALYLPAVSSGRDWFTQAEFEQALRNAGYDPAIVGMFTWAEEHPTSTAQDIRLMRAYLDMTPNDDGDAHWVVFWWETGAGCMRWAEVAQ